jgi:uncharacterized protein (TIGR02145 family)
VVQLNEYLHVADEAVLLASSTDATLMPDILAGAGTVSSYSTAKLTFDASTDADATALTTDLTASDGTSNVSWSTPFSYQVSYGVNAIYMGPNAQDVTLTLSSLTFAESATVNNETVLPTSQEFTFKGVTFAPGILYTLNFKVAKSLYWATGNLKYNGSGYETYSPQYESDNVAGTDLFVWNTADPAATTSSNKGMLWKPANDLCKKLGTQWRTPSLNEFDVLVSNDDSYIIANTTGQYAKPLEPASGKAGIWFGVSETELSNAISADLSNGNTEKVDDLLSKDLFLSSGTYWSATPYKTGGSLAYYVPIGNADPNIGSNTLRSASYAIRCITDYE